MADRLGTLSTDGTAQGGAPASRPTTAPRGPWPNGCLGAVSLTFDDGMRSQLEVAIPVLEEHGLQATFYLNPPGDGDEDSWRAWLAPWRAAAQRRHEIG